MQRINVTSWSQINPNIIIRAGSFTWEVISVESKYVHLRLKEGRFGSHAPGDREKFSKPEHPWNYEYFLKTSIKDVINKCL